MKTVRFSMMLACAALPYGQAVAQTPPDQSPHASKFIARDTSRLHYLDWGGTGPVLLLLPDLNSNAHTYDEFAPLLKDAFHVIALTPRAHGESGTPADTMTVAGAADDIRLLLDSLHIERANIAAHGLAGAIMTDFAVRYPERVIKLVYLDATTPPGENAERVANLVVRPPKPPEPATPIAMNEYSSYYIIGRLSDAVVNERAAELSVSADEQYRRKSVRQSLVADAVLHPPEYGRLRAPALAVRAKKSWTSNYFWLRRFGADTITTRKVRDHIYFMNKFDTQSIDKFKKAAPNAQIEVIDAQHLLYITEPLKTATLIRNFLAAQ